LLLYKIVSKFTIGKRKMQKLRNSELHCKKNAGDADILDLVITNMVFLFAVVEKYVLKGLIIIK
jgi:hypothetical protein